MLNLWFIAMRPWSFTAAFVPIALGAALAWLEGSFNFGLFFLTLFGGVCMQAGTNLINTYGDYISGVDTIRSAKTCPQLVTGMLKPQSMKRAGILTFALAVAVGLLLTYLCGWEIFAIGVVGLIGGYCYTAGISPYKYKGWGTSCVFFLMGPLMAWPAYFIQTGRHDLVSVVTALPVGFLVAGILHANDIRDIVADRKAKIKTLALSLGLRDSIRLYFLLYAAAYLCLILFTIAGLLPVTGLLPIVILPVGAKAFLGIRAALKRGAYHRLSGLEADSAKFHFQFGLLLVIGLIMSPYIPRWWL